MPVKYSKKMEKIPFDCDCCGQGIGVGYEIKEWKWAGPSALCPACYRDLMRDHFLYIDNHIDVHIVMFADGIKKKVSTHEIEKLKQSIQRNYFTTPLD
jgi:hypothetical protein